MKRYAVVGASQGTGLLITGLLAARDDAVRAISRNPPPARNGIEPVAADVTDAASLGWALAGELDAVFYTVDKTGGIGGHALFGNRADIRAVSYQGAVNTFDALKRANSGARVILLSVMGVDQSSPILSMLNTLKPGLRGNVLDRENALKASGLPYVIIRAPKLSNGPAGEKAIAATAPTHKLGGKWSIARADLAQVMIAAADGAPVNSTWDVFPDDQLSGPDWLSTGRATAAR